MTKRQTFEIRARITTRPEPGDDLIEAKSMHVFVGNALNTQLVSRVDLLEVREVTDEGTFYVYWNDHVANEWSEIVRGPHDETERRLLDLAERGNTSGDFAMSILPVANDKVQPTLTTEGFFALDWGQWLDGAEDPLSSIEALARLGASS